MKAVDSEVSLIHVDPEFVVIDKPAGLLSVPGRGPAKQDCAASRFKEKYPGSPDHPAVHRLDMDTSGLMVLARTVRVHKILCRRFADRQVNKKYIAILDGVVAQEQGRIELAFRLDPENRPHQVHDPVRGRVGITDWRRLVVEKDQTRVEFLPLTGRTHQLRLHASHFLGLGHPIVGDRLYGRRFPGQRMLLHATELSFAHPLTGLPERFFSEVPF